MSHIQGAKNTVYPKKVPDKAMQYLPYMKMEQLLFHFFHYHHEDYKILAHLHILDIGVCKHSYHKLNTEKGHSVKFKLY